MTQLAGEQPLHGPVSPASQQGHRGDDREDPLNNRIVSLPSASETKSGAGDAYVIMALLLGFWQVLDLVLITSGVHCGVCVLGWFRIPRQADGIET